MKRRVMIVGVLVIGVLAGIVAWALQPVVAVDLDTVNTTSGTIVRRIVATGTLEAVRTVDVGSQVSGNIQTLYADFNSIVHAGQIIARLDPSLYEAQLRQAQATLGKARADQTGAETVVRDAEIKLSRAEALGARQLIPQSDLDAARIAAGVARADLSAAKSNVVDAEAQVRQAQLDVDRTAISSPIDGIVVARDVDVGQTLAASVQSPTLFSIATDLRRMQVQVAIDESDVDGIVPGEPVRFQVGSYPSEPFHGVVEEIRLQPVTSTGTTTTTTPVTTLSSLLTPPAAAVPPSNTGPSGTTVSYTTIVDVDNPDERLRPGMTATVVLDGSRRENAMRIPNLALMFRPSADVLAALHAPDAVAVRESDDGDADVRMRLVWLKVGTGVAAKSVRVGLSDGAWTELVGGGLTPDVPLVTSAKIERQTRIAGF